MIAASKKSEMRENADLALVEAGRFICTPFRHAEVLNSFMAICI
jgi:hypothetical protein